MPDFLLELYSEEIPARLQERGAADLAAALLAGLGEIVPTDSRAFSGPRRIAVWLGGLPDATETRRTETRGPRKGAPAAALDGFVKSVGLAGIEECSLRDTGRGEFYFAVRETPGRTIDAVLAATVPAILDRLIWPKSMRWAGYDVRWVRPLHRILAILSDGAGHRVVPVAWPLKRGGDGPVLAAGDVTEGHRFLAPSPFAVTGLAAWRDGLRRAHVLVDAALRRRVILDDGAGLAAAAGLKVRPDPGLLDEVAGLVEWPVVMLGRIEPRFMALPPELLATSMRAHQKYFACEHADGGLAPFFLVVANNLASDGGARILAGNERVLRARLADAEFFWNQDRASPLASRIGRLGERVFHARLGTVLDKVARLEALVPLLAALVPGADAERARRAARLAKADLSTALVGEFPELQGVVGGYLARHDGEPPDVAHAIGRHYAPAGPHDPVPSEPLAIVVALADKLDTLAGFFAIGEAPTGSGDPYALRRAALGVIRIIRDNGLRLGLRSVLTAALGAHALPHADGAATVASLLDFFADRLKIALRDEGIRHDFVGAVLAEGAEDDLCRLVARARALQALLGGEDGANLLIAYRRAARILAIEEKKDGRAHDAAPDADLLSAPEERLLAGRLQAAAAVSDAAVAAEDFAGAMAALAGLRGPVDAFFEKVTVNVDDQALRANRLRLLARIRAALDRVADFSRIEG